MSENFRREEESHLDCSYCQDVGTCSYCERGQEEAQKLKEPNIWKKIRASGKRPRKKAA